MKIIEDDFKDMENFLLPIRYKTCGKFPMKISCVAAKNEIWWV